MQIDLTNFVVSYFSSSYPVLKYTKYLVLTILGEMPVEIAVHASCYSYETSPPDIQIALIRSRAMVVQVYLSPHEMKSPQMMMIYIVFSVSQFHFAFVHN